MLSDDIKCMADALSAQAETDMPLEPEDARRLAVVLYAAQLMAAALEATKITQAVADRMSELLAEQRELRG